MRGRKGFSFAFAASSLAASLESSVVVLALFGLRYLLVIASTLLLSHGSFERVIGAKDRDSKNMARVALVCLILLLLGVVLELAVVPKLLALAVRT